MLNLYIIFTLLCNIKNIFIIAQQFLHYYIKF